MQIEKLRLSMFKGLDSFTLEPNGRDMVVYGNNETGKTTLADAYLWALTGKDSLGQADFEIKTLVNGKPVHNANHLVEVVINVGGRRHVLVRDYHEVWTQKRGSPTKTFSGHKTDYMIDDVPKSEADYAAFVNGITGGTNLALLSDPYAFCRLPWQKQRAIVMELAGEITDADVIAANGSLSEVPNILDGRTVDEFRIVANQKKRKLGEVLKSLPIQLGELKKLVPHQRMPLPDVNADRAAVAELERKRAAITETGGVGDLKLKLQEIEAAILARKTKISAEQNAEVEATQMRRNKLLDERISLTVEMTSLSRLRDEAIAASEHLAQEREVCLKEFAEIDAENFVFSGELECAACGQPLPADQVEAARANAEAAFNKSKAARLESNQRLGRSIRLAIDKASQTASDLAAKIAGIEPQIAEITAALESLPNVLPVEIVPETDARFADLFAQKSATQEAIDAYVHTTAERLAEIDAEIARARNEVEATERLVAEDAAAAKTARRIAELEASQMTVSREYEEIERHVNLLDEFVRTKMQLATERARDQFAITEFKLFDMQVNQGVTECCEAMHKGVPYSSLNHAARLNVGLDIINALGRHWGFTPPVFIDNAESVTNILPTAAQQIWLVVSADDNVLRAEALESKQEVLF